MDKKIIDALLTWFAGLVGFWKEDEQRMKESDEKHLRAYTKTLAILDQLKREGNFKDSLFRRTFSEKSVSLSKLLSHRILWEDFSFDELNFFHGQGSEGILLKGIWKSQSNRLVAIKTVTEFHCHKNGWDYENEKERLENEGGILMTLKDHSFPNLISILGIVEGTFPQNLTKKIGGYNSFDDGDEGEESYSFNATGLLLEFFEGFPLFSFLHRVPKRELLPLDQLYLMKEVAQGLVHLHSVGIVHGDLKSSNILINKQKPPSIKLIDFGLSSVVDISKFSTYRSTMVTRGTIPYCAPGKRNTFLHSYFF